MSEILQQHKKVWEKKKILRAIYHAWYRMILKDVSPGKSIELGAGTSNFKEAMPEVITSDISQCDWLDMSFDAHQMPFENKSIDNLIMIDVLHHLADPVKFFHEAARVLKTKGRVVMLEPYPSPFSLAIFKRYHPEPFFWDVDYFKLKEIKEKEPFDANQAIPHIFFFKQLEDFNKEFGVSFSIKKRQLLSFLLYPASGGFENPSKIPYFLMPLFQLIEFALLPFKKLLAFRCYIVIEKKDTENNLRTTNEIEHGKLIAEKGEQIWNWSSPAGKIRWSRRVNLFTSLLKEDYKDVLEVGCGTGLFTEEISKTNHKITAIDISKELQSIAQKRVNKEHVTFKIENIHNTSFHDNSFDFIIGSSVLHHLNVEQALKEMLRILKPGGMIMFTEPNMLNPQIWMERNIGFIRRIAMNSPDETAFIRWKLKKQLNQVGFTEASLIPFDFLHPAIPKVLIPIIKPITSGMEYAPLLKEISGSLIISAKKK